MFLLMSAPVQCVCPDVSMCVIQTPRDDPLLPQPKIASDCLPNPRGEGKVTRPYFSGDNRLSEDQECVHLPCHKKNCLDPAGEASTLRR